MPLIASIDIGTNTVRLLAARVEGGRIVEETLNLREITRLGSGLGSGGRLDPAARERTLGALRRYAGELKAAGARGVSVIATEALRKAADARTFIADVKDETGFEVEIISGEEEARRTLLGVKAGISGHGYMGKKLILDIGGGSTEFVVTDDSWELEKAVSLPLGAVSLFERFLINDPPAAREVEGLEVFCYRSLAVLGELAGSKAPTLIGTAGTITTLAAVDLKMEAYDPLKVTGHEMSRETVARLQSRFAGLPTENRKLIAGIEPGREDIILSGTALLGAVMDRVKAGKVIVCDFGLREGNLLYYFEKARLLKRLF